MPPARALEGEEEKKEEEEAAAAQVPGDRARCRPLSGLPGGRGSVPRGRPRCPPAGGSGKAVWAVGLGRPGLAAAPWDSLAHSGGRETQAWEESGIRLVLPVAARLGVTLSFWGPLQKGLRTSYVPGTVVVAAGPSEQGHTVQC